MPSSSSSHSPPPSSSLPFLLARQIRSRRTNDESPSCQKLYGPPTKAARHPAAVVTQWLSFLFCFFVFLFFSLIFSPLGKRRSCGPTTPRLPTTEVPRRRRMSRHVTRVPPPRHEPAASPRRGSTSLPRPWNASPRHVTPHPHPILLPRNDAPWGPPHALPSPLLTPPRRFGTPHHHGMQDPSPRHTTPPRRHIAASRRPTTVPKPAMPSRARHLSRHASQALLIATTSRLRPPPYPLY